MKDNVFCSNRKRRKSKIIFFSKIFIVFLAILFAIGIYVKDKKENVNTDFVYIKNINMLNENKTKVIKMEKKIKKANKSLGNMPTWNLSDLYTSLNDEAINSDIIQLEEMIKRFQSHKNVIKYLNGEELYETIIEYQNIQELIGKLSSYAYLKYAENLSLDENVKFYQKINEKVTTLSSDLVFFSLEINKILNVKLKKLYSESAHLRKYKSVVEEIRSFKPHQLDEDLEKLMLDKSIVGRSAWLRLFDETIDNIIFEYNGEYYNESEMLEMMNGNNKKIRNETSKIFGETLETHGKLFAYITNVLAKDKKINDNWRNFKTPISSRNLSNLIEDSVVESLRNTVKNNYKNTSHRYYKWKAKQFKTNKLHYSDRNAPLPNADNKVYSWQEAREIVVSAYQDFSSEMKSIGDNFFNNNWIDVPTRQGKKGGGFMMPTTPKVHPYILLNYTGRTRDVMTLAHELGHGIHQTLADKNGYLMSQTPLTLAETASVFGEQLTFRKLLDTETDLKKKKIILASKIEDMLNTVVRQIAFLEFETKVHEERKNGEIPLERLNEIWIEVQKESLGENNFIFDDEYKNYWMYIPHFIHSPFYVYSYAFGDCLVNSLYGIYQENPEGFQEKYIALLSAGGSKKYDELLKPFGLEPKDPKFWQKGIDVIIKLIDELENME
jgi:oligoendopeptidase F